MSKAFGNQTDSGNKHHWRHHRQGPHFCWETCFVSVFGSDWKAIATDKTTWSLRLGHFITTLLADYGFKNYIREPKAKTKPEEEPDSKRRKIRIVEPLIFDWSVPSEPFRPRLRLQTDSLLVSNWMMGIWKPRFLVYKQLLRKLHRIWEEILGAKCLLPSRNEAYLCEHVLREHNGRADELAKRGLQARGHSWQILENPGAAKCYYNIGFDAGLSEARDKGSIGWWIDFVPAETQINTDQWNHEDLPWREYASGFFSSRL